MKDDELRTWRESEGVIWVGEEGFVVNNPEASELTAIHNESLKDNSVLSGGNQGAPLLTEIPVVCGEKPWTVREQRPNWGGGPPRYVLMIGETEGITSFIEEEITNIIETHEGVVARLTARIRELEKLSEPVTGEPNCD